MLRQTHPALRFSISSSVRALSTSSHSRSASPFVNNYDPTHPIRRGPIFRNKTYGVPQFYPRDLKQRVDKYVVGQDRAKKVICATIFNHYQALRRRRGLEQEEQTLKSKLDRQRFGPDHDFRQAEMERVALYSRPYPHWSANELPRGIFHHPEITQTPDPVPEDSLRLSEPPSGTVTIDKSNLLLIGPTGVGKTHILETLARQLKVPFTIADCNSFTQAGYIGQDVESCIERLLAEANNDVSRAEHGIVVLDEFDKLARRDVSNGRDVSGEGVQQGLLKLVEGTKVTVNVKEARGGNRAATPTSYAATNTAKETAVVDTRNILFVCCGAFVGLEKIVLSRVSKPTMGFGGEMRGRDMSDQSLPADMFAHLPHYDIYLGSADKFTPMDLATPADLQQFGFIPELIGRLHNICALSPLSIDHLYRVLTEPCNSLVSQYTTLFETYPSRLYFTQKALVAIAERASKSKTGARGLKMEMERVLAEPMYLAPMPYVLITEACVQGKERAGCWGKDGRFEVERRIRDEDGDQEWTLAPQHFDLMASPSVMP